VTKVDLLSDAISTAMVKVVSPNLLSQGFNLTNCKAITHPSNNSIFVIDHANIHLFDNTNELLLSKPVFPLLKGTTSHAVAYNEGYIYMIGGYDPKT
jgi:hypothetical protein